MAQALEHRQKTKSKMGSGRGMTLETAVNRWDIDGQQDRVFSNIHGKSTGKLNPAWVAQLMGTTLEKTFFVPLATAWLSRPPK
jgi:hypothetical protein